MVLEQNICLVSWFLTKHPETPEVDINCFVVSAKAKSQSNLPEDLKSAQAKDNVHCSLVQDSTYWLYSYILLPFVLPILFYCIVHYDCFAALNERRDLVFTWMESVKSTSLVSFRPSGIMGTLMASL